MAGYLIVECAGIATSVQDLGRPGLAHLGVTRSGAADRAALVLANRLAGNPDGAAAFESSGGLVLRAGTALCVAVVGPGSGEVLSRRAGEEVRIGAPFGGVRAYVAVRGGIAVRPVLASRSWDTLGRIGPPAPRAGDRLPVGPDPGTALGPDLTPRRDVGSSARVWPGPRAGWLQPGAFEALCRTAWTAAEGDRVGLRLDGAVLARRSGRGELPSEGLLAGAIQVPPDGRPIVMLADHPVTGGYPVLAVVDPADMGVVAQAGPGATVRFVPMPGTGDEPRRFIS